MARKEVEVDKKKTNKKNKKKKKRKKTLGQIEQVLNFWLAVPCTFLWLAKTFGGTISDN